MASVFDVAQYINDQFGTLTKIKLHKLLYFCQAWYLALEDRELFPDDFVAWELGPVIPKLHHALHEIEKIVPIVIPESDVSRLTNGECSHIDKILNIYGDMSKEELVSLTHEDNPWKNVKKDELMPKDEIKLYYRERSWPIQ